MHSSEHSSSLSSRRVVQWLWGVYAMIFCMVVIGGVTRLTGSGLSMVEWRPLMGSLPPLSEAEWLRVFDLYKASPQYQEVNHWMTLSDFKSIFFWEYVHRLFGRLIGLVFFFPWLYFTLKGHLVGIIRKRAFIALLLGGSQGLMGWYMVKSGLVDRPEVSHFRLAAHLSLAFLCGMWVFSLILTLRRPTLSVWKSDRILYGFLGILILQIIYGAFMAGTRAGYLYQTFPDLNGSWIAPQWGMLSPWWKDLISNPDSIHFLHRTLAWVVMIWGGVCVYRYWSTQIQRAALYLGVMLSIQFILGVCTVVFQMPTSIAAAHQGGSFLLLTATLYLIDQSAVYRSSLRLETGEA